VSGFGIMPQIIELMVLTFISFELIETAWYQAAIPAPYPLNVLPLLVAAMFISWFSGGRLFWAPLIAVSYVIGKLMWLKRYRVVRRLFKVVLSGILWLMDKLGCGDVPHEEE